MIHACAPGARIQHVAGPDDLGPAALAACERLAGRTEAESLVVADLRIAPAAALFVDRMLRINAGRAPDLRHQLVIVDHHAGTAETLRTYQGRPAEDLQLIIDTSRCAARLVLENLALFGAVAPSARTPLERLVALVEVVDLWRKDDPRFEHGLALSDALVQNLAAYIPPGHRAHDRFVADFLGELVTLAYDGGLSPGALELQVPAVRKRVIDRLLGDQDPVPNGRSRARLAGFVAEDPDLVHAVTTEFGEVRIAYGLDADLFQQIADRLLDRGPVALVAHVHATGQVELRSRAGQAGALARRLGGGGHPDAAGGEIAGGAIESRAAGIARFCSALGVTSESETNLSLVLHEDATTYDILDEGLPIRLRGRDRSGRSVDALVMPCGRTREETYGAIEGLRAGTRVRLRGRWQRVDRRTGRPSGTSNSGPTSASSRRIRASARTADTDRIKNMPQMSRVGLAGLVLVGLVGGRAGAAGPANGPVSSQRLFGECTALLLGTRSLRCDGITLVHNADGRSFFEIPSGNDTVLVGGARTIEDSG